MRWVDDPDNTATPWLKSWVPSVVVSGPRVGKATMSVWVFVKDDAPDGPFYFNTWNPKQLAVGPFETIEAAKVAAELTAII